MPKKHIILLSFIVLVTTMVHAQKHRNLGFFNRQSLEVFLQNKTLFPVTFTNPHPKLTSSFNYAPAIGILYHKRFKSDFSFNMGAELGYDALTLTLAPDATNYDDTAYFASPALKMVDHYFYYQVRGGLTYNRYVNRSGMLVIGLGMYGRYMEAAQYNHQWTVFAFDKAHLEAKKFFHLTTGYRNNKVLWQLVPAFTYRFMFQSKNYLSLGVQSTFTVYPSKTFGSYSFYLDENPKLLYGKINYSFESISAKVGFGFTMDNFSKRTNYLKLLRSRDNYTRLKWRNEKQKLSDDEVLSLNAFTLHAGFMFLPSLRPTDRISAIILEGKPRSGFKFGGEYISNQKAIFDLVYGASVVMNNYNLMASYTIPGMNNQKDVYKYHSGIKLSHLLFNTGLEIKLSNGRTLKPLFRAGLNWQLNVANKFYNYQSQITPDTMGMVGVYLNKINRNVLSINPMVSTGLFCLLTNKDMVSVRLEFQYGIQSDMSTEASLRYTNKFDFSKSEWSNNYLCLVVSYYFNKSNRFSMVRLE